MSADVWALAYVFALALLALVTCGWMIRIAGLAERDYKRPSVDFIDEDSSGERSAVRSADTRGVQPGLSSSSSEADASGT